LTAAAASTKTSCGSSNKATRHAEHSEASDSLGACRAKADWRIIKRGTITTRGRRNESKCLMALVATCLAFSKSAFAAQGRFDRILPVSGPVEVIVRTGAGTLTVSAGNESSVQVRATIRAQAGSFSREEAEKRIRDLEARPPLEQQGNTITLGGITEPSLQRNISISYDLVVPAATRLKSKTGSGDQTIKGILGPLEVSAGSGSVKASNIGGDVEAATGSGKIRLEAVAGKVQASTGSGGIEASGIGGGFEAVTGSGDVILDQSAAGACVVSASGSLALRNVGGPVLAKTAAGSISAEGGGREPWRLETVSGSVSVRVPLDRGFDLRAYSLSGSIFSNRPLTLQGTTHCRGITGKAGNGGFLLDASSVSGNIHIDWLAAPQPLAHPLKTGL